MSRAKPSFTKTVYACGDCGKQDTSLEKADACCMCKRCGDAPVEREHGWRSEYCFRCRRVVMKIDRARDIKRVRAQLDDLEADFAKLESEIAELDKRAKRNAEKAS